MWGWKSLSRTEEGLGGNHIWRQELEIAPHEPFCYDKFFVFYPSSGINP